MNKFIQTSFSYNGDVLLAGIASLLLVVLFVLLLHVYAKWFLTHNRHRRRSSVSLSGVLGPARLRRINSLIFDTTLSTSLTEGLGASAIAAIPLFVYEHVDRNQGLECAICLSLFEEGELGRKLPNCGHEFHVRCVDTWLNSRSNCPICRSAVKILGESKAVEVNSTLNGAVNEESQLEIVVESRNSHETSNGVEVASDPSSARLSSASLSSQMATMGGSLKRMVSKNINERKIHPSSSDLHEPED